MILKCQSCGKRFDKDTGAICLYFGSGETERFCPYCGSDDLKEVVKRGKKGPAH